MNNRHRVFQKLLKRHATQISTAGAHASEWVIPTDEEIVIARHTARLLQATTVETT